jgi:integrase
MSCDYLSRGFKRMLRKHGLPDIRLHDLRHACASYMIKMGCSMKEVADLLGHSDIKTTMNVYAHLDIGAKKEAANRLGAILSL